MILFPFIFTVPQGHCAIIEMFGKPCSVKESGLNFYIPIIQRIKKNLKIIWGDQSHKEGKFIELTEQLQDVRPRTCYTKDNVQVEVDCAIRWRIIDPIKAVYEVEHLHKSLEEAILGEVRVAIGSRKVDEVISSRTTLSEHIVRNIIATTTRWGIAISGIEIQRLDIDKKAQDSMLRQIEAERVSRALALEAEGKCMATIKVAEAEKQASILKAEGISVAMRLKADAEKDYLYQLSEVVGVDNAAKILLTHQTIEGYATISSNPADKVYLPNSVRAIIESSKT